MKYRSFLSIASIMLAAGAVHAQPCPHNTVGAGNGYTGSIARAYGTSSTAAQAFIGGGCANVKLGNAGGSGSPGAPTACTILQLNGTYHAFRAMWTDTAARTLADSTMAGCRFTCPGGTCFVNSVNGLPVELLDFSVREDDGSDQSSFGEGSDSAEKEPRG